MEDHSRIQIDNDINDVDLGQARLTRKQSENKNTLELPLIKLKSVELQVDAQQPNSPRILFLKKKFKNLYKDEIVLDNFTCAFTSSKILLQGMLYLTNNAIYFYSPFNAKTILG